MKKNNKNIHKQVSAYLDGELDARQARIIEELLVTDKQIKQMYDKLNSLDNFIKSDLEIHDPYFITRLNSHIYQPVVKESIFVAHYNWLVKMLVPVTVLAGILVGVLLGIQMNNVMSTPTNASAASSIKQYLGNNVLPVIPEGSLTENYIKLNTETEE